MFSSKVSHYITRDVLDKIPLRRPSELGDIMVITVHRSGNTWLTEMFDMLPYARCIKEPVTPARISHMRPYFKPQIAYIDPDPKQLAGIRRYYADILSNKIFRLSYYPKSPGYKFRTNLNILVVTHMTNLAAYLEDILGFRVLYLVRHPIAQSLSKLRNRYHEKQKFGESGWRFFIDVYLESESFCETYLHSNLVKKCWYIRDNASDLERYVLHWCLENIILIKNLDHRPWLLVTYEDLVLNPDTTLKCIAEHFVLTSYHRMIEKLHIPSRSTRDSEEFTVTKILEGDKDYLVSGWRHKLSEDEIFRCFEIIRAFDIDLYQIETDNSNLNYDIFKSPHRPDLKTSN